MDPNGKYYTMAIPLVLLGPGGDYQVRYNMRGKRLIRTVGTATGDKVDAQVASNCTGRSPTAPQGGGSPQATLEQRPRIAGRPQRQPDVFAQSGYQPSAGIYGQDVQAGRAVAPVPINGVLPAEPAACADSLLRRHCLC